MTKSAANEFEGDFQARALELKEDFAFDYRIDVPASALSFIAYRAPEQISAYDLEIPRSPRKILTAISKRAPSFTSKAAGDQQSAERAT